MDKWCSLWCRKRICGIIYIYLGLKGVRSHDSTFFIDRHTQDWRIIVNITYVSRNFVSSIWCSLTTKYFSFRLSRMKNYSFPYTTNPQHPDNWRCFPSTDRMLYISDEMQIRTELPPYIFDNAYWFFIKLLCKMVFWNSDVSSSCPTTAGMWHGGWKFGGKFHIRNFSEWFRINKSDGYATVSQSNVTLLLTLKRSVSNLGTKIDNPKWVLFVFSIAHVGKCQNRTSKQINYSLVLKDAIKHRHWQWH
jgi:hypothetical protein